MAAVKLSPHSTIDILNTYWLPTDGLEIHLSIEVHGSYFVRAK